MTWTRVNRVMVSVRIWSAPVWCCTCSRAAAMTALASGTESRMRAGTAVLVSRRDAVSTVSVPNASIAAATAAAGS